MPMAQQHAFTNLDIPRVTSLPTRYLHLSSAGSRMVTMRSWDFVPEQCMPASGTLTFVCMPASSVSGKCDQ
jgi:hypothetical protein